MMREQSGATENKDRYGHTLKERGEGKRKVTDHPAASDHMDDPDILFDRANSLKAQGQALDAADLYALVIDIAPRHAQAYANLGDTYVSLGKYDSAETMLKASLLFEPENSQTLNSLGSALIQQGRPGEAMETFRKSLELNRHNICALTRLGDAYKECGRLNKAVETYHQALAQEPTVAAHNNILSTLDYLPDYSREEIFQEHRRWNDQYASPFTRRETAFDNTADPEKRLRVGLVSGSFQRHPVGYMTIAALEAIDPNNVELYLYSTGDRQDDMTERFRNLATSWRNVTELSDQDLAETVRKDHIDILIDLAGHAEGFRLLTFARRPAPIQAKWIGGQSVSTAMKSIDYFLSDSVETPKGDDKWYTEKVVRLPNGYVCYEPPDYAPSVAPLPAAHSGYITFGCFNSLSAINDATIALWAQINQRIDDSRLILKNRALNDATVRQYYIDCFTAHGGSPDRLELRGASSHEQTLAQYGDVDIALDPFPYSGGLTTVEALWMGVPVITLPGPTFAGRHAATHLTNVGLTDWLCGNQKAYVKLAQRWSKRLDKLAVLRTQLRDQVATSPLCDAPLFAHNFEAALRDMWRHWCQAQQSDRKAG